MTPTRIQEVARALLGEPTHRTDTEWRYGTKGSLSIDSANDRWYDHEAEEGGGVLDLIRRETGTDPHDWLRRHGYAREPDGKGKIHYVYRDAEGNPVFRVIRHPKGNTPPFTQERYDQGKFIGGKGCMTGVVRVPYRLPELLARPDDPVYLVEGEKDADRLVSLGLVATCNPGGAGKWPKLAGDLNPWFDGREVIIIADHDDPGRKHADQVTRSLRPVVQSIRRLELAEHWPDCPHKGDVSDYLNAGHTVADLLALGTKEPSEAPQQDDDRTTAKENGKLPNQATVMIGLANRAALFHDADGNGYATIPVNGHAEHHRIRSRGFKDWLTRLYYQSEFKVPSNQALQDAINLLDGRARFDGPERRVFVRVAEHDGKLYLDLCDRAWRAIEIDAEGWRIIPESPVIFQRHKGMLALPDPVAGKLSALWRFINVTDPDQRLLVCAWLLACFRPRGPYPVLCLQGEQGSAKSTTTRLLRALIDPHSVMLRTTPRDERDLVIGASRNHVVAFDNLSGLGQLWLSDALCRLATGGGFATRQLYSDDEELLIDVCRPAMLNGIGDIADRNDLIDRAIIVHLERLTRTATEGDLYRDFEAARPGILGALLGVACDALGRLSSVELDQRPRMADFAVWATAAETALGYEAGRFMAAYTRARESAIGDSLEGDLPAQALMRLRDSRRGETWTGTPTQFYHVLLGYLGEDERQFGYFPKSAKGLRGHLTRKMPALRQHGIHVEYDRTGTNRNVKVDYECKQPSQASQPSQGLIESNPINDLTKNRSDGSVTGSDGSVTGSDGSSVTNDGSVTDRKYRPLRQKPSNGAGSRDTGDGCDGYDGSKHPQSNRGGKKRVRL